MGEIKVNGDLFLRSFGVTVIRLPSRLQTVHNHFNNNGDGSIYGKSFVTSLIIMVPSMASLRSVNVCRTKLITRCMRSISCLRKMFMDARAPIF